MVSLNLSPLSIPCKRNRTIITHPMPTNSLSPLHIQFSNNHHHSNFRYHQHLPSIYLINLSLSQPLYRLYSTNLHLHLDSLLTNTLRWDRREQGHAHLLTHQTQVKTSDGRCRWTALSLQCRGKLHNRLRNRRTGHRRRQAIILNHQRPHLPRPQTLILTRMMPICIHSMLASLMAAIYFKVNCIA